MTDETRPISDLSDAGLLWLINRQVFHPRGFALALEMGEAGEIAGWRLLGEGLEPWNFTDGDENEQLAAANRTLSRPDQYRTITDPEALRVVSDPALTAEARVYEVLEPDIRNPDWPVRYRLDLTTPESVVLSQDQPGPFLGSDTCSDLFITLEVLARLGRLAEALLNDE